MRITIDTDHATVRVQDRADAHTMQLYSKETFELLSQLWLKLSCQQKYSYTFTWLGRPIIQHPEDALRLQEVTSASQLA